MKIPESVKVVVRGKRHASGTTWRALLTEGKAMKRGGELTWPQVLMAANAPIMTKAALVDGRTDVGVLPTGQVVGLLDGLPSVAEIIEGIMGEAEAALTRLSPGEAD